jgi:hypothetical protein
MADSIWYNYTFSLAKKRNLENEESTITFLIWKKTLHKTKFNHHIWWLN